MICYFFIYLIFNCNLKETIINYFILKMPLKSVVSSFNEPKVNKKTNINTETNEIVENNTNKDEFMIKNKQINKIKEEIDYPKIDVNIFNIKKVIFKEPTT